MRVQERCRLHVVVRAVAACVVNRYCVAVLRLLVYRQAVRVRAIGLQRLHAIGPEIVEVGQTLGLRVAAEAPRNAHAGTADTRSGRGRAADAVGRYAGSCSAGSSAINSSSVGISRVPAFTASRIS